MTRVADLKRKLVEASEQSDDLHSLVDAMRSDTDQVSTMLLARLRLGASIQELVGSLRLDPGIADSDGAHLASD